uniref:ATP synthase complex subunit 8 n=1 Tax=Sepedophilus bipunctatus TaxID=1143114 RepID=A0A0S2M8C1_9COLE|nr:ATP synthase F0 subunit 8 [Sepedophilus bipunctatus]ALO70931.1 ATP synthase F0 subunit 8 [Sepedophilus bipunctatus]
MPQMAPMNWLMLLLLFSLIFMTFNSINYFMFMYNYKKKLIKNKIYMKMNWKW